MREGSLEAPTRHPLDWQSADFWDEAKLEAELERVFDICHGCRRCFNLCDSFPRLFDLVDESSTGELDGVAKEDYAKVIDACTLCDMCFMTKCPYVPPHSFNLDFPHLMLRARAVEARKHGIPVADKELAKTDRNGLLASLAAPVANWGSKRGNKLTRPILEKVTGIDRDAALPPYASTSFESLSHANVPIVNKDAPAHGRKAVLYATCFTNYNTPGVGMDTRALLALNGVQTEIVYPKCCGMPLLEQGDIAGVAANAQQVAAELGPWIDKGYDVIALVPSCSLMLKFEWKLILPEDKSVAKLAAATYDISEYIVDIAKKEGLAPGLQPIEGGITVHLACHARAQNMGQKAAEMLKLLPDTQVNVIERCSGHGGSMGFQKDFFETGMKVGRPVARSVKQAGLKYVSSECPLAGLHIAQGVERQDASAPQPELVTHPIQFLARAYGIGA